MSRSPLIVVALSGGVDSATTAAMLVEAGHRVVGITMHLYDARGSAAALANSCCGTEHVEDARRVCERLDIPFHVVDFAGDFARDVVDDFVDAYLHGETPNPCIKCNQHIKFEMLLTRARALGADSVATGHYARVDGDGEGGFRLRRGLDPDKDQSYFLFSIPRHELAAIRFPLGAMTKGEVRALARSLGLHNAGKGESQEICFIPDGDYAAFVERRAHKRGLAIPGAGDIVDLAGKVVGRHQGTHHYTIGQRRGLGVSGIRNPDDGGRSQPVYVVAIDPDARRVVVGPRASATSQVLEVGRLSWLVEPPVRPESMLVQVRYRARPVPAMVAIGSDGVEVTFEGDEPVAAPGQAAVFYRGDQVLGGGWIRRSRRGG